MSQANAGYTPPSEVLCPNCKGGNPPGEQTCRWCGTVLGGISRYNPPPAVVYRVRARTVNARRGRQQSGFMDYFYFRSMVTPSIIRFVYILGAGLIVLASLGTLLTAATSAGRTFPVGQLLLSLAVLIIGNLLWRLVCESIIIFFSIHERLREITRELRQQ